MMKKTFMYGFEKDEFVEFLIEQGHYNVEEIKIDGVWIVTW